jgi:hypothetical protein
MHGEQIVDLHLSFLAWNLRVVGYFQQQQLFLPKLFTVEACIAKAKV